MKKILKIALSFILFISIGFTSLSGGVLAAEIDEWTVIDPQSTNDVNKKWTVSFSGELDESSITNENVYVQDQEGNLVNISTKIVDKKLEVTPINPYVVNASYTLFLKSSLKSITEKVLSKNTKFTFTILPTEEELTGDVTISSAGTYGGTVSNVKTFEGDVIIKSDQVTLENAIIKGKLIVSKEVGEGEVSFDNITVEGDTEILGGGPNSVYFNDSVLMTVIVNKNNGSIRVVAQGSTSVKEVLLETVATLEESSLNPNASGFSQVDITEGVQNSIGEVKLLGSFDTVNVLATNVQITLSEETSIEDLVLSAIAKVTGAGTINYLTVSPGGNGSTVESKPHSVVLDITGHVTIAEEEVTVSYSDVDQTSIQKIEATPSYIRVDLVTSKVDLTKEDFVVTATLMGQEIELENLTYLPNLQMFTHTPIHNGENPNELVTINVAPNPTSTKVTGTEQVDTYELESGFSGRITDIYGNGAPNLTLRFEESGIQAYTDRNGYYSINAYSGVYYGTISGPGYVNTNIVATVTDDSFTTGTNETAIRGASSQEMKIMLSWNDKESDVDSHLASENFHVYYGNDTHGEYSGDNYYEYVDLDWDDTDYYGPETTTIRKWQDGRYVFFLHNYSGMLPLTESESKVQIFKGNSTSPDYTFNVPQNTGDADYWGVFELFVSDNGQTIEVKELNVTANDEVSLINPVLALQYKIDYAENYLVYLADETSNSQIKEAIVTAKKVLTNTNATTKQIIDQLEILEELAPVVQFYGEGPIQFYEGEFSYEDPYIDNHLVIEGFIKDLNSNWYSSNDQVKIELEVTKYNYETNEYTKVDNLPILFKNSSSGEEINLVTDELNPLIIDQDSYANIIGKFGNGFSIDTKLPSIGEYMINMKITGPNDQTYGVTYYHSYYDLVSQ